MKENRAIEKESPPTLDGSRARLTRSTADMAELERGRLHGELLPANEVRAAWSQIVITVRTRLLAIPTKIAARLALARTVNECKQVVESEIREALEELKAIVIEACGGATMTSVLARSGARECWRHARIPGLWR